eukprot:PITA_18984
MKLVDIAMNNGTYTWNNKRGGECQVASKLDRFIISKDLMIKDKDIVASVLPFGGLDHWPVELEIQEDLEIQSTRIFLLQKSLIQIKLQLKEWNKKEYGNIFQKKYIMEGKLQRLNQTLITEGFDKEQNDLATKYHQDWDNLGKQEEILWRQKPRVQWLKEGDRNTGFFDRATMANKAHNNISTIKDKKGNMLNMNEEIEAKLVQYF